MGMRFEETRIENLGRECVEMLSTIEATEAGLVSKASASARVDTACQMDRSSHGAPRVSVAVAGAPAGLELAKPQHGQSVH